MPAHVLRPRTRPSAVPLAAPIAARLAAFLLCAAAGHAQALVIADDLFTANGGNLGNIPATIAQAMEPQREASYASQFLPVGSLGHCTATWIGDSPDLKWSYLLSAAHCLSGAPARGPYNGSFRDWSGRIVARGQGEFVLNPNRLNRPSGMGGASTDIGLLRLPRLAAIVDQHGNPVPQPLLYDGSDEVGQTAWLAGYGAWGTGTGGSNGGYSPVSGPRRAAGPTRIDSVFEREHGIGARFTPSGGDAFRARVAPGDSGSAWWQRQLGHWTIIATTNGGHATASTGARVSRYASWLRSEFPQARFLGDAFTVTESRPLETPNYALDAARGTVAFTVPPQTGVRGPTTQEWRRGVRAPAMVTVTMQEAASGRTESVTLRGWRDMGCGTSYYRAMNNGVICYSIRAGRLILEFQREDNRALRPGVYEASFTVLAQGWHDPSYQLKLPVKARIQVR